MGITFFGVDELAVGTASNNGTLTMPKLGIRYWLAGSVGLDIGLGLGIVNTKDINTCPAGDCDAPSVRTGGINGGFGIGLHLGLPIAISKGAHHALLFIPEFGLGYGTMTLYSGDMGDPLDDISMSGLQIDAGIRIGAEVHFGGIGLQNLSLQLSIGLGIRYRSGSSENSRPTPGPFAIGEEATSFQLLSIHNNALNGTLRLNYYF